MTQSRKFARRQLVNFALPGSHDCYPVPALTLLTNPMKKHPHQNGWGCRRITESGEEQLLESVWPFNLCQPILIQFNMLDGVAAKSIDDVNYPIGRLEN